MDYEKKYKNALEWARQVMTGETGFIRKEVEDIFPELKESEDERIRKEIISALKYANYKGVYDKHIAWLEKQGEHANFRNKIQIGDKVTRNQDGVLVNLSQLKRVAKSAEKHGEQKPVFEMKTPEESLGIDSDTYNKIVDECIYGEQKPTDKVEPKFKVGDWIINGDYTWQIVNVTDLDYILQSQDRHIVPYSISHADEQFHSFTIEDAKAGDTLRDGCTLFIFKESLSDGSIMTYCDYYKVFTNVPMNLICSQVHPATTEQRDLLFQKMHEAGYEWDAEKKELKKIEQSPIDVRTTGYWHVEDVEQNPAWSEEDERMKNQLVDFILSGIDISKAPYGCVAWLKSLKDRYTWKPSDEQMKCLDNVKGADNHNGYVLNTLYNDLKKLKG